MLRESIAKVDHDDVDVDIFADDALDDELERQAAEAEAAQRRRQQGDDNADDAGAGVIGRTGRNERGDRGDEGSGGSSGGGGYDGQGGGSADGGLDQPREPRAVQSPASAAHQVDGARRVKTCTYQKYKKVERSICVYIRGAESELGAGMLQADVVEWYLNQQEDIASVDDLAAERRLVKQIIQRLLTADKILLQVAPPSDRARRNAAPHDARYLTVRPHELERTARPVRPPATRRAALVVRCVTASLYAACMRLRTYLMLSRHGPSEPLFRRESLQGIRTVVAGKRFYSLVNPTYYGVKYLSTSPSRTNYQGLSSGHTANEHISPR